MTGSSRAGAKLCRSTSNRLAGHHQGSPANDGRGRLEFLRYHHLLERLEARFERLGAELNLSFTWKDRRPASRSSFGDLQERVGALMNAAASTRTAALGLPLRRAASSFQKAAGCYVAAHDLTKANIWGLTPRWPLDRLTVDVRLDFLSALRDTMLAQAQRAFYDQACAESPSNWRVRRQCATAVYSLFDGASAMMRQGSGEELARHTEGESGLFRSADKTWMGCLDAARLWADALADEASGEEAREAGEYGVYVARLSRAAAQCRAALVTADAAAIGRGEVQAMVGGLARLEAAESHAKHENATIYMEAILPAALGVKEGKVVVRPLLLPSALGGTGDGRNVGGWGVGRWDGCGRRPLAGLRGRSLRGATASTGNPAAGGGAPRVGAHHASHAEHRPAQGLSGWRRCWRGLSCRTRSRRAHARDRRLPSRVRAKIEDAKASCASALELHELRQETEAVQGEALTLAEVVSGMLREELFGMRS